MNFLTTMKADKGSTPLLTPTTSQRLWRGDSLEGKLASLSLESSEGSFPSSFCLSGDAGKKNFQANRKHHTKKFECSRENVASSPKQSMDSSPQQRSCSSAPFTPKQKPASKLLLQLPRTPVPLSQGTAINLRSYSKYV